MSHLVVDQKVLGGDMAESPDSEQENRELKQQAPIYVKKIVNSDYRMDTELLQLYRSLHTKTDLRKELAKNIDDQLKESKLQDYNDFTRQIIPAEYWFTYKREKGLEDDPNDISGVEPFATRKVKRKRYGISDNPKHGLPLGQRNYYQRQQPNS